MEFHGKIKNGTVVFEVPPPLPEGTEVSVHVIEPQPPAIAESVWGKLLKLAGTVEGPHDWARNHDHYIHGAPKRE